MPGRSIACSAGRGIVREADSKRALSLQLAFLGHTRLVEQLGIEPGPELQELERAILRQDAALTPAEL